VSVTRDPNEPAEAAANPKPMHKVRAPIDTSRGVPTPTAEFNRARKLVADSGLLGPLQELLDSPTGRPRSLSVEGFLVAFMLKGMHLKHGGLVVDVARILNAFTDGQRQALGIKNWNEKEAYDRTDRLFVKLDRALRTGWATKINGTETRIDEQWFADRLAWASIADLPVTSRSLAVDGTAVETWGSWDGAFGKEGYDGEPETRPTDSSKASKKTPKSKAQDAPIGPDNRRIYTTDVDARAGWRTATNNRRAGYYNGYELHLATQTRDITSVNGIDKVKLGPDVPNVVTSWRLTPAGSHRANAIVPALVEAKEAGQEIDDVVWDRGYSQCVPETTVYPLGRAGIRTTFWPMDHQRRREPYTTEAIVLEGMLFTDYLPEELKVQLPMPPEGSSEEEKLEYEEAFNRRARYRYQLHQRPDEDGFTRWLCPFHAGFLRSRELPDTMRRPATTPLVDLPKGATCCQGIVSASPEELPLWQQFTPGTTAWRISMGRRNVVEGANGGLKGNFVNIERKFMRVMGLTKMTIMLAFTIAGMNLEIIRSFKAKKEVVRRLAQKPKKRMKRRDGTLAQILDAAPRPTGRAPP